MTSQLALHFSDEMALGHARDLLRTMVDEGHECPCCTQFAKVYRRKLTSVATRALIALYRHAGQDFAHMPTVARKHMPAEAHQGGYLVLSAHWGLMAEERERRPDGGRVGWWRVTDQGARWIRGETTVPQYARIYDGRCLGLTGKQVTVSDVLGSQFDYSELMAA